MGDADPRPGELPGDVLPRRGGADDEDVAAPVRVRRAVGPRVLDQAREGRVVDLGRVTRRREVSVTDRQGVKVVTTRSSRRRTFSTTTSSTSTSTSSRSSTSNIITTATVSDVNDPASFGAGVEIDGFDREDLGFQRPVSVEGVALGVGVEVRTDFGVGREAPRIDGLGTHDVGGEGQIEIANQS